MDQMFGGMQPDKNTQLLSDVTLDKIDYEWIKQTVKVQHLKKAVKLIEQDGDYYPDLKKAVVDRIRELDPSSAPKNFDNKVSQEQKKKLDSEIHDWEEVLEKKEKIKVDQKSKQIVDNSNDLEFLQQEVEELNQKKAENEKNKGNEALRSKDFDEAIMYYTKSIEFNPLLAASYCNRALVYLKQEKYDQCIKDCNKAISIDKNYIKAYHRRGKAQQGLKQYNQAYQDFRFIMDREPDNNTVNADLQTVIQQMKKLGQSINEGGFKRVQIIEEDESDSSEEEVEVQKKQDNSVNSLTEEPEIIEGVSLKEFEKLSEKLDKKKETAVQLIKDGLYEKSIKILKDCVSTLEECGPHREDPFQVQFQTKRCQLLNNIALCYKQMDHNKDVVEYCSKILLYREILPREILIKAFLRRAMALEKEEKFRSAKNDFVKVKELDPSNMQASQGLQRTIPHQDEEKETNTIQFKEKEQVEQMTNQIKTKKNQIPPQRENKKQEEVEQKQEVNNEKEVENNKNSNDISSISQLKESANQLFKEKKIEQALAEFQKGALQLEKSFKKQILDENNEAHQLYMNIMTNRALCELKLQQYDQVLKTTDKVLSINPQNSKAIYRKCLAQKEIAYKFVNKFESEKDITFLKVAKTQLESIKTQLQDLSQIEKNNKQVKQELQEVMGKMNEIRVLIIEQESRVQEQEEKSNKQNVNDKESQFQPEGVSEQIEAKKPAGAKIDQEFLNNVASQAMGGFIEQLISNEKLAQTASEFEKNVNAFKKCQQKLVFYINKYGSKIQEIYNKKEFGADLLMNITNSIKGELPNQPETYENLKQFYLGVTQTKQFNLLVMCLSKSEKKILKEVMGLIDKNEELNKAYKL